MSLPLTSPEPQGSPRWLARDEDIQRLVRAFKASVAEELESLHRRLDEMEAGLMNELRSQGRRIARLEGRA